MSHSRLSVLSFSAKVGFVGASIFLALAQADAQTVSIPGLYTTGVDNSNVLLGENAPDSHYVVVAKPASAPANNIGNSRTVTDNAKPGDWAGNTSTARWITTRGTPSSGGGSHGENTNRVTGEFDFRLVFNMPTGAILSTVSITGSGWADDSATIYVNGTLVTGQSTGTYYGSAGTFSLNSSNANFQAGSNEIIFRVNNSGGGPTGLLINSLSGTVAVPEVGAILPIFGALALYGLVIVRRKSARTTSAPTT